MGVRRIAAVIAVAVLACAPVRPVAAAPQTASVVPAASVTGTPYAFGNNSLGQLGDGTTTAHHTAAPVTGLTDVVALSGGRDHEVALTSEGTVVTWGSNQYGQLGIGVSGGSRTSPVTVPGLTNIIAVATGHYHSMALSASGAIWTWGYNATGQLGDGTTTNRTSPVQISGGATYTAIAGGRDMSYAIRSDGTLWAWGLNTDGELGNGTTTNSRTPVRVGSLTNVVDVAGGRDHGLAILSDGTVWAWGWNEYGMVGDGTTTDRLTPVEITTSGEQVEAGAHHSLLLKTDGSVWSWGRNYRDELGDGTTTNRLSPVRVLNVSGAVEIGAGRDTGFAILSDGTVRAWGDNTYGQLGDGTTTSRTTAVKVTGVTNAIDVGGGAEYSVVLESNSTGNQPPTASITDSCTGLTCSFSGANSTDPDGTISSYQWTFGDGGSASGVSVSHPYATAGSYSVSLTVTDNDGATGSTTTPVTVSSSSGNVTFIAGASASKNLASNSVTIPSSVAAGDQLIIFLTANANTTSTTPTGWTLLGTRLDGSDLRTWAFTSTATGTASTVKVTLGETVKSGMSLLVYRGASGVTVAASANETGTSASHASPPVTVASPSLVVSYWADKTNANTGWTVPASVTSRLTSASTGSGRIVSVAGDSSPVNAGSWPGVTATSSVSSAKEVSWSVVVPAS